MGVEEALAEALDGFEGLASRSEVGDAWDADSALAGYTIGGLTAHVVQGVGWLASIAATPASDADDLRVVRPGGYFAVMKREPDPPADTTHDAIVASGNDSARHGWRATVERLRSVGAHARSAVAAGDVDRVVDLRPTLPFGTSLRTFVATRVVELVVHGDDLAVSIGRDGLVPGDEAFRVASELLVATAAVQHDQLAVMRALSRRERSRAGVLPVF